MSTYKTKGIILKRVEFAEADRILIFLTPQGKVSTIAKGVRRMNSKLGSHLELFGEVELMLAKGRNLDVITSARLLRSFDVGRDYELMRRGFLFLEMTEKLTDKEPSVGLYDLLINSLDSLTTLDPDLAELSFKLKLLLELGYTPQLHESVVTHQPVSKDQEYSFDASQGGIVERQAGIRPISHNEIKLWRLLLEKDVKAIAKVSGVNEAAISSMKACNDFYDYTFGKRFKSSEI